MIKQPKKHSCKSNAIYLTKSQIDKKTNFLFKQEVFY